jgi:hypothetical protein
MIGRIFMAKKTASAGGLRGISVRDLHAELRRRERESSKILRRRAKLVEQLREIDQEIREAGLSAGGEAAGGRVRPKNAVSLVEALAKVLKGKTLSVTDAAEAVQASGYQTTAANFRTIVNQALIKNSKIFKKVERGMYTSA